MVTEPGEATKLYAFYFPQFHEDELNSKLWGDRFTEWDRLKTVTKNRLGDDILKPSDDLGYYNLLDKDVRKKHSDLAKRYGINGFIYHHYWFYQEKEGVLSKPLDQMLIDHEPNISFAMHWANHPWLKTWSGHGGNSSTMNELLHAQLYPTSPEDPKIKKHYEYLRPFFHHPNYIKIHGLPLFMIYEKKIELRVLIPVLRRLAIQDGFPPPGLHIPEAFRGGMNTHPLGGLLSKKIHQKQLTPNYDAQFFYPSILDQSTKQLKMPSYCYFQTGREVKPSYASLYTLFDNSPRRNIDVANILNRKYSNCSSIDSFRHDLLEVMMYDRCCQHPKARKKGGKFVIINAWNEWGEGMVLEPSRQYGYGFLEAVNQTKDLTSRLGCDWSAYHQYRSAFHNCS